MKGYSFLVSLILTSSFSFSKACDDRILEDVDFFGNDITVLFSPTVEHCQSLCTEHPQCLFFTFIRPDFTGDTSHFECYLKSTSSGQPSTQNPRVGFTSGFSLKSCSSNTRPSFSEVFQNVDFLGADYRTLFTSNYGECQRACTQDAGCQFFTFITGEFSNKIIRYKCHLKYSWNIPRTPVVEKKTGVTSGFALKSKQTQEFGTACENQFFANTDIPGSDFEVLQSVSPEYCQILCSAHPKCTYFSFSSSDFKCYLKDNPNGLVANAKEGFTSGLPERFCQLDDTWVKEMYEGVDFFGSDIRFELMDDVELCKVKCDEDPNCQFYTYISEAFIDRAYWRRCYLKRVITIPAPPKVNKLQNVVSGFSLNGYRSSV